MEENKNIEQPKKTTGNTLTAIIILICTLAILLFAIILKQKNAKVVDNEFATSTDEYVEETHIEIFKPEEAIKLYAQKAFIAAYVEDILGYGELQYGFLTKGFKLFKDEELGFWCVSGFMQLGKNEIPYSLNINLSIKNDPPVKIDDYEFEVVYFDFNYEVILNETDI